MTLESLNLPRFAGEVAEDNILHALATAVDLNGQLINVSVSRGFDAEIADVIMANPLPDAMPLVRLNVWNEEEELAMTSTTVFAHYTASLYVFYYYGTPSLDPTFTSFVNLRRRHIQACLTALQLNVGASLTTGIDPMQTKYWKRDTTRPVVVDYQSPFRYLDKSIQVKAGFNCTRVDYPILVNSGA